jgi:hypothetical protein
MTLPLAPGTEASGEPRVTPIAVFGSVRGVDGRLFDVVPDEGRLRKALGLRPGGCGLESIVTAAADALALDRASIGHPIAYVAIGLGPALPEPGEDWWKGDFDDAEHPRWPAGTPDGQGGRFRPKDEGAADDEATRKQKLADKIRRLDLRRRARIESVTAAKIAVEAALNVVPVVGEGADLKILYDLAEACAEFGQLRIDINAAIDFIKTGPHSLDELRVSQENQSFTSFAGLKARLGAAVSGFQLHHIVEQSAIDGQNITARMAHNTENVVRIPTLFHEAINERYSGPSEADPSRTVREWLQDKSYEEQRAYGLQVMRDLGIIR